MAGAISYVGKRLTDDATRCSTRTARVGGEAFKWRRLGWKGTETNNCQSGGDEGISTVAMCNQARIWGTSPRLELTEGSFTAPLLLRTRVTPM